MSTAERAIAIVSCLSRFLGARSSGSALVRSTTPTAELPTNAFAFPIIAGQVDFARPFRSAYVNAQGHAARAPLTSAGVAVPITSCLGGLGNDLPVGTRLAWFPANPDVEQVSEVATALSGGTQSACFTTVKSATWYVDPSGLNFADDLLRSTIRESPAVVVSWSGRRPLVKAGTKLHTVTDLWSIFVVVNRAEAHHTRGLQGVTLVDLICAEFAERASVDGIVFSSPPAKVVGAQQYQTGPGWYVYRVQIETSFTVVATDDTKREEAPGTVAPPWEFTEYRYPTTEDEGAPNLLIAGPLTYPQP